MLLQELAFSAMGSVPDAVSDFLFHIVLKDTRPNNSKSPASKEGLLDLMEVRLKFSTPYVAALFSAMVSWNLTLLANASLAMREGIRNLGKASNWKLEYLAHQWLIKVSLQSLCKE